MDEPTLAHAIEEELADLRSRGSIPVEVALGQEAWNLLRRRLEYRAFGARQAVQFRGLPCVLIYGMRDPRGFRVRAIEPRA